MSTYKVWMQLRERRLAWMRERANSAHVGRPDFLNGIMRGFDECVGIAEGCHRQAMAKRPKLSRWSAAELYEACLTAIRQIEQRDYGRAKATLTEAVTEAK